MPFGIYVVNPNSRQSLIFIDSLEPGETTQRRHVYADTHLARCAAAFRGVLGSALSQWCRVRHLILNIGICLQPEPRQRAHRRWLGVQCSSSIFTGTVFVTKLPCPSELLALCGDDDGCRVLVGMGNQGKSLKSRVSTNSSLSLYSTSRMAAVVPPDTCSAVCLASHHAH